MAKTQKKKSVRDAIKRPKPKKRSLQRWLFNLSLIIVMIVAGVVFAHRYVAPPATFYMNQEKHRLGKIKHQWVSLDQVAPVMARSLVAAEDANYCQHWGFDMNAIRDALSEGTGRGASTISQQVVKNVYLWHGRNYTRKALEAVITPMVEAIWSKRRIIEVYLNVAEFDEGVFGIKAASRHYFGVEPRNLTAVQAARLAAVLPSPKKRSASKPSSSLRKRTAIIRDGAATIRLDGRSACFED